MPELPLAALRAQQQRGGDAVTARSTRTRTPRTGALVALLGVVALPPLAEAQAPGTTADCRHCSKFQ